MATKGSAAVVLAAIAVIITPLGVLFMLPVLLPAAVLGGGLLVIILFSSPSTTQPPYMKSERLETEKPDINGAQRGTISTEDRKDTNTNEMSEKKELHVLHGGEAAKQVAEDLAGQLKKHGWEVPSLAPMDSVRDMRLEDTTSPRRVVIFVVETVENGQPSESAGYAVRLFNRKRKQGITDMFHGHLEYAVLGLGDSNLLLDRQTTTAKDCNQAAQVIDSALLALGAHRICQRGEADDRTGLAQNVTPWVEALCNTLLDILPPSKPVAPAIRALSGDGTLSTEIDTTKLTGSAAILARMRRDRAQSKKIDIDSPSKDLSAVIIAYGSQTGNCKEIATNIHSECKPHQIRSTLVQLNDFAVDTLTPNQQDALEFIESSIQYTRPIKFSYTLLGLGDQNYTSYMAIPRLVRRKLEELGAVEFYASKEVDEVEGIEEQVEPWVENLWGALDKALKLPDASSETNLCQNLAIKKQLMPSQPLRFEDIRVPPIDEIAGIPALYEDLSASIDIGNQDTFGMKDGIKIVKDRTLEQLQLDEKHLNYEWLDVVESHLMTQESSDRRVICLTLKSRDNIAELHYHPGDSIVVPPQNDPELVTRLIKRLECKSDDLVRFGATHTDYCVSSGDTCYTVEYLLTNLVDITSPPKKSLLRALAEFCKDEMEKKRLLFLSSKSGVAHYKSIIREGQPGFVDILEVMVPSCAPPLKVLFAHLPRLAPRYYSIASSTHKNPNTLQIAFTVVDYVTKYGNFKRQGVATNWLQRIAPPGKSRGVIHPAPSIPVAFKSGGAFRPPPSLCPPVIMVGPGTGVSPFIGFLQERDHFRGCQESDNSSNEIGEAWLFFGCRRAEEDFLFRSQLESFEANGCLTKLFVAYSRAQEKKVYVQNKMSEYTQELGRMIVDQGAYIYVCGDGAHMAKDVHAELIRILEVHGKNNGGKLDATEFLGNLVKERKYVRDIWS